MATLQSFDITTGCDLQEVDNAVNQATKEIAQRFDFKGLSIGMEFRRAEGKIVLTAPDEFKLQAVWSVLLSKLAKRGVPMKNLKAGEVKSGAGSSARQEIDLQQGISKDVARAIVKVIKDRKMKSVQATIQEDQVRVSSPSRDELQTVMALLKQEELGVELKFGNYRSG